MAPKRVSDNKKSFSKKKKTKHYYDVFMNKEYNDIEVKKEIRDHFVSKTDLNHENGLSMSTIPFPHVTLPNFISNEDFLEDLNCELNKLKLIHKNNDLYKFKQSTDLRNENTPAVSHLKKVLYEDMLQWLKFVTNIPLSDDVFMTCSKYEYTDILLCHDDELEGRRIAFIFYLVPNDWKNSDGGNLDLFTVNDKGQPSTITKSITPVRNQIIFFEVSPISFHQVAEVLTNEKERITIGGWFHGPNIERPSPFQEIFPTSLAPGFIDEKSLYNWVNPSYIDMGTQAEIREKFRDDSEIELEMFINEEKYELLCKSLKDDDIKWIHQGPPNKRCYNTANLNQLPEVLKEFVSLMRSEAMFLILSNLTGLRLHKLASFDDSDSEEDTSDPANSTCNTELRQWGHKSYTLLRDNDAKENKCCLNALMHFNCDGWNLKMGGYTSFIANGEDEELLTVEPRNNCLALVYKDVDTLNFVKYVNNEVESIQQFHSIDFTYYE